MNIFTTRTLTKAAAAAFVGTALLGAPAALASAVEATSSPATSVTASAPGVGDDGDSRDRLGDAKARWNNLETDNDSGSRSRSRSDSRT